MHKVLKLAFFWNMGMKLSRLDLGGVHMGKIYPLSGILSGQFKKWRLILKT